jgi:predicted transcriptional regulator
MSSGSEKKRVQFRAPRGLVDRADSLAAVLETDRTDILISALREYLRDAAHSDEVKQEIADAYYDGEITYDELKDLVGREEAANFRVLKAQLTDEFVDEVAEEMADS